MALRRSGLVAVRRARLPPGQAVLGELLVARSLMVPMALRRSGLVAVRAALAASVLA
jgi:hypothetical protein